MKFSNSSNNSFCYRFRMGKIMHHHICTLYLDLNLQPLCKNVFRQEERDLCKNYFIMIIDDDLQSELELMASAVYDNSRWNRSALVLFALLLFPGRIRYFPNHRWGANVETFIYHKRLFFFFFFY